VGDGLVVSLTPYVHLASESLAGIGPGATIRVDPRARHHLDRVLRLQAGARIEVADGGGREAPAILGDGTVVVDGPVIVHDPADVALHLLQALPKGRKCDDVIRSATELGVDVITVVVSARTQGRPDADRGPRLRERWVDVARAAAEQSRRPWLPEIHGLVTLQEALASLATPAVGVIGHPDASMTIRAALAQAGRPTGGSVVGAVGPEGGWTAEEVEAMTAAGLQPATLGAFTLRTEHAGFALCTVLAFYLGRMG